MVACASGSLSEDGAVTEIVLLGCNSVSLFVPCRDVGLLSRLAK